MVKELMILLVQWSGSGYKSQKNTIHYIDRVEINLPYCLSMSDVPKELISVLRNNDIGQELGVGAYLNHSFAELK